MLVHWLIERHGEFGPAARKKFLNLVRREIRRRSESLDMNHQTGRIQLNGSGVGEISDREIEQRAREIARMDGRDKMGEHDIAAARAELLHPGPPDAPEADENEVELWSNSQASRPHRGVRVGLEDEQNPAELLINEGLEEAERDQRLKATDRPDE